MMNHSGDPVHRYLVPATVGRRGVGKGGQSGIRIAGGRFTGIANLNKANLGDYASPYALMKYDEVLFIQAEAIQRGWIAGGERRRLLPERHPGFDQLLEEVDTLGLNITDKVIEKFPGECPPTTERSIINQIRGPVLGGYEAWADYRRTGYPVLTIGSGTFNDHILPTRLVYPTNPWRPTRENGMRPSRRLRDLLRHADDIKTPSGWVKAAKSTKIK